MRYVFISYNYSRDFNSPDAWFLRTAGYSGVMEALAINNTVINIKQVNYQGEVVHNGVQYHFVGFDKKRNYFPWRLNQYIKSLNPDVAIVHGLHHPLQLIQLRLLLPKKVKIIAQHHAEQPFTGVKRYVQRLADKCLDAYLFASAAMGAGWVRNGNLASLKKIHEVMEVSSIFSPVGKDLARSKTSITGTPVFLWVGRLNKNKDPLTVVNAFLRYAAIAPDARLYMIFHTDELLNDIKKVLAGNSMGNRVILVGKLPHHELQYWYSSADFFISGSHYEGSGTALCEAMSCGCVPIVTNIDSFRMITDNGNCGLLYQAGNEVKLFAALTEIENIDIEEIRRKSLASFGERLSFEAIAGRISEIAASL